MELVRVSPYGPFFRFVVEIRELSESGRHHEALAAVDEYEWVARAFGDEKTVDFVIQRRMYTYLYMGQYEPALTVGGQLLDRHRAAGNGIGEAKTLADLAELCLLTGRLTEGMRHLARAGLLLEATTRRGDRYVSALNSYGDAALAAGLYEIAAAVYEDYRAAYGPEEDCYLESVYTLLLVSWGLWLDHLGHTSEAAHRLRRAATVAEQWLDAYRHAGFDSDVKVLTGVRALVLAKRGDVDEAIALAVPVVNSPDFNERCRSGGWMAHLALAVALRARGEYAAARREILAAMRLAGPQSRTDVPLLLRYELAALAADAMGRDQCTDLMVALDEQARRLWAQRRTRLTMLHQARQREELESEQARTQAALVRDPLTGLGNRRQFDEVVAAIAAGVVPVPLSLLIIDVDRFKEINDTWSHSAGDEVLQGIAAVLRAQCRAGTDTLVRYAGDEFAVFLHADLPTAVEVAERIRTVVAGTRFAGLPADTRVSVSTGVAMLRAGMSGTDLFTAADANLYRAKRAGRDRIAA